MAKIRAPLEIIDRALGRHLPAPWGRVMAAAGTEYWGDSLGIVNDVLPLAALLRCHTPTEAAAQGS